MRFARPQVSRLTCIAYARAPKLFAEPRNAPTDNSEDEGLKKRWLRKVAANEQDAKRYTESGG
jgi:hypothetical protein